MLAPPTAIFSNQTLCGNPAISLKHPVLTSVVTAKAFLTLCLLQH